MDRPTGYALQDFIPPAPPGPQSITGQHARLERLDPGQHGDDLIAAARGHDWIWDYISVGPFGSDRDYRDWMAQAAVSADPYFYAIRDQHTGRVGGFASFMRIDPVNGVIEIGFIVMTPQLQRRPAATEAISLMIGWAFQNGYRRVEWKCDALNAPSKAAAARYGFTEEGLFRQHMVYKGRNRDTSWWSIIDREWPRIRAAHEAWLAPGNFDADGVQRSSLSAMTRAR